MRVPDPGVGSWKIFYIYSLGENISPTPVATWPDKPPQPTSLSNLPSIDGGHGERNVVALVILTDDRSIVVANFGQLFFHLSADGRVLLGVSRVRGPGSHVVVRQVEHVLPTSAQILDLVVGWFLAWNTDRY